MAEQIKEAMSVLYPMSDLTRQRTDNLIKVARQTAYLSAAKLILDIPPELVNRMTVIEFQLHCSNLMHVESVKLDNKPHNT